MKVVNLVFNRVGNSFSAILEYPEFNLQITDEVRFTVKGTSFEISGVSVDISYPLEVYLNAGNRKVGIFFNNSNVHVGDFWELFPSEEGFISGNSEMVFISGIDEMLSRYLKDGSLLIPQEDFFKILSVFITRRYGK
ncbi:MAG: hypothetical protein Q9M89_00780 [Persephonella sp.]|nr:hypothetical protein [Persephonella sp.]